MKNDVLNKGHFLFFLSCYSLKYFSEIYIYFFVSKDNNISNGNGSVFLFIFAVLKVTIKKE